MHEWRALQGPGKEVMFEQEHHPGREGAFDFTDATELGVTVASQVFVHLLFQFVLSFSKWRWVSLTFSPELPRSSEEGSRPASPLRSERLFGRVDAPLRVLGQLPRVQKVIELFAGQIQKLTAFGLREGLGTRPTRPAIDDATGS